MLKLENINKIVDGEVHIQDVSLELAPGTLNVLLGRTRAGKTTLMRLMAGLERPTGGRVLVNGEDVTGVAVQQRAVAMVYQQFINYPSLTVYDNIASPLRLKKLSKAEIDRRVREVAEVLHIETMLDRLPSELSGGQQQRTSMARALVKDAGLLLLDEPLVNLDYKLREELRAELPNLIGGRDTVVVYATTEPGEALLLGGNTAVLHEGRLLQFGPSVSVFHRPASIEVGTVFSDPPLNLIEAEVSDGALHLGSGQHVPLSHHFADLPAGSYIVGVRANHLYVNAPGDGAVAMQGQVELAEITGSETFVHLRYNAVSLVMQEDGVHNLPLGETVAFYLDPARLYLFDADGRLLAAPAGDTTSPAAAQALPA